jgi:hypothetical protein
MAFATCPSPCGGHDSVAPTYIVFCRMVTARGNRATMIVKELFQSAVRTNKFQMKAFLDHFAAILGVVTITLLLMSVSHEYVGRHFQSFLTTSDYGGALAARDAPNTYGIVDWDVLFGRREYQPIGLNWPGVIQIVLFVVAPLIAFFFAREAMARTRGSSRTRNDAVGT